MKKLYACRRCVKRKAGFLMVPFKSGFPSNLCLECEAKDRLQQEQYEKERA